MIRNMLSRRPRSPQAVRARRANPAMIAASRRTWLSLDVLEARTLLSTIPIYKTFTEGIDLPDVAHVAVAPTLPTAPMQRTELDGTLPATDTGDVVAVALTAGELLTLNVSSASAAASPITLELIGSAGAILATNSGVAIDPDLGSASGGPALSYHATTAGTYDVALINANPATAPASGRSYSLFIRPISPVSSPNTAAPSDQALSFMGGGMYAFLQRGVLEIVGPTGYGFDMTGNWSVISTSTGPGQSQLTFVANAGVKLDTPLGMLSVPLGKGASILVSTKPNGWGTASFGEVNTTKIVTGYAWVDSLAQSFNHLDGVAFNLPDAGSSLDATSGFQFGLALGSTINNSIDQNAPLNPAVPYLYAVYSNGLSASFGNVSVSAGATKASLIIDPADPSIYVGATIPGLSILASVGLGFSYNGLIPLSIPNGQGPTGFQGTFRGHVYLQYENNFPIPETDGVAAVNINGRLVVNVDATGDHKLRTALTNAAGVGALSGILGAGVLTASIVNDPTLLDDLSFGAYGKLGLTIGIPNAPISATFTLAQGDVIFTGTASPVLYEHGSATNNFAAGTFLENFTQYLQPTQTFTFDATATPGNFTATFMAAYSYFGATATVTTTIEGTDLDDQDNATLSATVAGTLSYQGNANVAVTGYVDTDGSWQINASASLTLAGFTLGSAVLQIDPSGFTFSGNVNLGPIGTVMLSGAAGNNGNYTLTGTYMTNFGTNFVPQVNAMFTLTNSGLAASAMATLLSQQVNLSGTVSPGGSFSLTGSVATSIAGFALAGGTITVTPSGLSLSGKVTVSGIGTIALASAATTSGNFVLTGSALTDFGLSYLPQANANFTLSNSGLSASTTVSFLGQSASLSGSIQTNGNFSLTGTIVVDLSFPVGFGFFSTTIGIMPTATVTLANSGGNVSLGGTFHVGFGVTGFDVAMDVSVFLASAGTYSGTSSLSINGTSYADLTINNNALAVGLLGLSFSISLPF